MYLGIVKMKRLITKLPDATKYKTGYTIKYKNRLYEKKISGRWATVVTKELEEEVYQAYCVKHLTLKQCKEYFNKPGLPTIPIQKILEENNWFRSHYKHGRHCREYINRNLESIKEAIYKYKIPRIIVASYIGVSESLFRKVINCKKPAKRVSTNLWVDINVDVNALTYHEYRQLVRFVSHNMVRLFGKKFGLNKPKGIYHLDHKYSLFYGYYTKNSTRFNRIKRSKVVPLKYMAHPYNLQYLTPTQNIKKGEVCSITGKELQDKVDSCKIQINSIQHYYESVFNKLGIVKNAANL